MDVLLKNRITYTPCERVQCTLDTNCTFCKKFILLFLMFMLINVINKTSFFQRRVPIISNNMQFTVVTIYILLIFSSGVRR